MVADNNLLIGGPTSTLSPTPTSHYSNSTDRNCPADTDWLQHAPPGREGSESSSSR